jgi:hypothetical protein
LADWAAAGAFGDDDDVTSRVVEGADADGLLDAATERLDDADVVAGAVDRPDAVVGARPDGLDAGVFVGTAGAPGRES